MSGTERLGQLSKLAMILTVSLFPIAVAGFRMKFWDFSVSFTLLKANVVVALLVIVLSAIFILLAGYQRERSWVTQGCWMLLCALLILGLYGFQGYKAKNYPFIHDVTTDLANPPQFDAVAALRSSQDHSVIYEGESVAAQQRAGYPDLLPVITETNPEQAFIRLKAMIQARGWVLVDDDPARGRLEAVITSWLFGFKDDLVIRIQPYGSGARIDMRSASRIGRSDLGANAARIRELRENFEK
ncbi:DUF1499 domain-containing protein [Aestuariirhabdus sp. Z084]|uniref:DUF1499 domain-containing protein n=1 Tax=Aestuariirhabdus haliotis TaxID=2918751 RepID=UPI00201B41B2|nr:DUF1499 domain-containing protein [Aestuariirhabdus haliotis]MCL6415345.1 DUF1499 domain-containing protein [Aestuariirhabdus haliotis]MCL6419101.1 DUF1499 domain-containing protein [Aestuariirhabdus haliotis]